MLIHVDSQFSLKYYPEVPVFTLWWWVLYWGDPWGRFSFLCLLEIFGMLVLLRIHFCACYGAGLWRWCYNDINSRKILLFYLSRRTVFVNKCYYICIPWSKELDFCGFCFLSWSPYHVFLLNLVLLENIDNFILVNLGQNLIIWKGLLVDTHC